MITSPKGKKYIGQTKHDAKYRFKKHVSCANGNYDKPQCTALNAAIRKYGAHIMRVETVWTCPLEELDWWEVFFIEFEESLAPGGYNLTRGGSHRKEVVSEITKDKISFAHRKLVTYALPRNVVEIKNEDQNAFGFIVIHEDGTRTCFTSINMTMEQKYAKAIDCYDKTKAGEVYVPRNKFKRGDDELDIPMYVTRRGEKGFAVNKPGFCRKTFAGKRNSRKENLAQAIEYLDSLP